MTSSIQNNYYVFVRMPSGYMAMVNVSANSPKEACEDTIHTFASRNMSGAQVVGVAVGYLRMTDPEAESPPMELNQAIFDTMRSNSFAFVEGHIGGEQTTFICEERKVSEIESSLEPVFVAITDKIAKMEIKVSMPDAVN